MKNLTTILLLCICTAFFCASQHPEPAGKDNPEQMIAMEILNRYKNSTLSRSELVASIALDMLETPYKGGLLEQTPERLVVTLSQTDCMVFVESCLALAITAQGENPSWELFCENLKQLRYRDGTIDGYVSRLHYTSDWFREAEESGVLEEITYKYGTLYSQNFSFISSHPQYYTQLTDDPSLVEQVKTIERGLNSYKYYQIYKSDIVSCEDNIKSGDIVTFTTNVDGLDVSHMGIAYRKASGELSFIHASSTLEKVVIAQESLQEYTKLGVRVARPLDMSSPKAERFSIPVLMFHKVVDNPQYPEDISPKELGELFDYLFSNGYYPINMSDLVSGKFENIIPSGRMPVVITADDSHPSIVYSTSEQTHEYLNNKSSFLTIFTEKCQNYGLKPRATFFLSKMLDDRYSQEPTMYFGGIESLGEIIQRYSHLEGIEYGYHTINHERMLGMNYAQTMKILTEQLNEIERLQPNDRIAPIFAYPYGYAPLAEAMPAFSELGFIGAVLAYPGNNEARYSQIDQYIYLPSQQRALISPLFIPRVNIGSFTYAPPGSANPYVKISPVEDFKKDVERAIYKPYHIQ